jgi:hypothetical protein
LGATENFMNLQYAKWLNLPIKQLPQPRPLYNVDGTQNKDGSLQYYTDLAIRTGPCTINMRFFLTNLGEHKAILGYPWFAAMQPNIDWKRGWIDHTQLPIVFKAPNAAKAIFIPRTCNVPRPIHRDQYYIGRVTIHPAQPAKLAKILTEYHQHAKVFSEEASQQLPEHTVWDHAIKLLPGAPATLPGRLLPLTQEEITEAYKFTGEHLKRGTI